MCVAAIMALSSIGSAYTGYQSAAAQAKMQNYMYEQNKLNSYEAMRQEYLTAQQRQAQEKEAAASQIQARRLEEMRQMATSNVASGEAGVSGFSVERILRDIGSAASRDVQNIIQNRDWAISQMNNEMLGITNRTKSRIQSVSMGVAPSPWSYGFQAVDGMAKAYTTHKAIEADKAGKR